MSSEIDLHGCTLAEAVDLFVQTYNDRVGRGDFSRFRVIHGYGSSGTGGKIRTALRKLLAAFNDSLSIETNPVNPGATVIVPLKRLPEGAGILTAEILDYCSSGKTESKVLGKFRRFGDLRVKRTLQQLVSQGKLRTSRKGSHTVYTVI